MDLWDIPSWEGIYALDRNSNQVWSYPKRIGNGKGRAIKGYFKKQFMRPPCPYLTIQLNKKNTHKTIGVHRLIYAAHHPEFDLSDNSIYIDHINQNKTDNRIENLRMASKGQNIMNASRSSKSGHRYIRIDDRYKNRSYEVQITYPNKGGKYTKNFKTLEEAISHRDEILPEIKGDDIQYIPQDFV